MDTSREDKQRQAEARAFERFERAMLAAMAVAAGGGIVVLDFGAIVGDGGQAAQQDEDF